ncbi:FAD/NAD(P)-binding oxidoreductase [Bdellovibrio sp. HCB2-146]|uniref:NAD(P)/FAD-dependent oxidoreductase n=1 Tax=Bdellovibrio sp. HCB2-146 TaxID=3394362 RepID=UPI0039BD1AAB
MALQHVKVLILGAGSGGVAAAARLTKHLQPRDIAIIEPAQYHYYQPLWTLVGAGLVRKEKTQKPMAAMIPDGVLWIQDSVKEVKARDNKVVCVSGKEISYEFLLVATGLKLDWAKIKGLEGNLGKNGLCSIYQYQDAEKTAQMIQAFKGGDAIFVMPPVPIKCAGAPQKIMYLADDIFRKNGVRQHSRVTFTVAGKVIFGVPSFAATLMKVVERKKISVHFSHKLIEVKAAERIAVFERATETVVNGEAKVHIDLVEMNYDLLHVVPPMRAHEYVSESGLAFTSGPQTGWLKVDQFTLQHQDHKNVFGIGDVTGVPNSKTGAAIRKQAPIVVQNMIDVMNGRVPSLQYDGYSSCPLITGFGKVALAEFGYDGKLMPTFPIDMTKERRSMWILKKDLLPVMYWKGMMTGKM